MGEGKDGVGWKKCTALLEGETKKLSIDKLKLLTLVRRCRRSVDENKKSM